MASTSALQVGGLASGLDTNAIIDGLVNIEKTRVTRVETQRDNLELTRKTWNELASRISTFATVANSLSKASTFSLYKATSNDDTIATVSGKDGAISSSFDINVQKLATSQKVASRSFEAVNTSLQLSGTFEISRSKDAIKNNPAKTSNSIEILPTDALKDIVNKINSAEGSGVKASILNLSTGENRLVLTAVDQGSDAFFIKETSGTALSDSAGLALISPQQAAHTSFNFLKKEGGSADGSTLLQDLFHGIGTSPLAAGDRIKISGSNADGAIADLYFDLDDPSTNSVDNLLGKIREAFGPDTEVSLNQSGEIVLKNTGGGTGAISMTLDFESASGTSAMILGSTKEQNSFGNLISEGTRSFYMLDGMPISSQSNSDDKTVVGAAINLKKADPSTTVKLGLENDKDGIKAKIQELVDNFNSILKFIDEKSKVEVSTSKTSDSNNPVSEKGPLANNATVQRLKNQLKLIMTGPVNQLNGRTQFTSLARVGVTTDRQTGLLEVDGKKLGEAIDADIDGVKSLFIVSGFSDNPQHTFGRFDEKTTKAGVYQVNADTDEMAASNGGTALSTATRTGNILMSREGDSKGLSITAPAGSGSGTFTFVRGIGSQLKMFIDSAKDPINGMFKKTDQSYERQLDGYEERIFRLNDQVDNYQSRLTRQFASLEQAMQRLKSQSSAFSSQISSM